MALRRRDDIADGARPRGRGRRPRRAGHARRARQGDTRCIMYTMWGQMLILQGEVGAMACMWKHMVAASDLAEQPLHHTVATFHHNMLYIKACASCPQPRGKPGRKAKIREVALIPAAATIDLTTQPASTAHPSAAAPEARTPGLTPSLPRHERCAHTSGIHRRCCDIAVSYASGTVEW